MTSVIIAPLEEKSLRHKRESQIAGFPFVGLLRRSFSLCLYRTVRVSGVRRSCIVWLNRHQFRQIFAVEKVMYHMVKF